MLLTGDVRGYTVRILTTFILSGVAEVRLTPMDFQLDHPLSCP